MNTKEKNTAVTICKSGHSLDISWKVFIFEGEFKLTVFTLPVLNPQCSPVDI